MAIRLNVVGLIVEDMARSLAFYRELGLDIPAEADREPHHHTEMPGGFRITWDTYATIRSFDPDWQPPTGRHRMGLAFELDTPADVDATYDKLVSLGYHGHKAPWDAFWGQHYAMITDPDGNGVDLYCPLP